MLQPLMWLFLLEPEPLTLGFSIVETPQNTGKDKEKGGHL
jgi:hypothetical protein